MNLQIYAEIKHAGGDLFDTSHKLFSALIDYKEKFDAPKYYRGKPPV
jgi:hypothetical protein